VTLTQFSSFFFVTFFSILQESTLTEGTDKTKVPERMMIEKEKSILQKFCPILINYLNGNVELQMTAIYALQVFCYGADFPKGNFHYNFLLVQNARSILTKFSVV
jgi:hypothetical protein